MDLGLGGKTALVTGGSTGIGRAVAHGLRAEGARVMICARDGEALGRATGEIGASTGTTVLTVAAELSERQSVESVAAEATSRLGRLDILANNAGAIKGGDVLSALDEEWMNGWSVKLLGVRSRGARCCPTCSTGAVDAPSTSRERPRAIPPGPP